MAGYRAERIDPARRQVCWAHLQRDFRAHAEGIRSRVDDPLFGELVRNGVVDALDLAVDELDGFTKA